jgi:hypothetical protein
MPPGETLWQHGEPTRVDSVALLRVLADGAASPEPGSVVLPVAAVVGAAIERFGQADIHDIETHFDVVVLALDGARTGEPPGYLIQLARLFT